MPRPIAAHHRRHRWRSANRWVFSPLAFALAIGTSCTRSSPRKLDAVSACPPVDFIERLHAATFHFEHGSSTDGRAALAQAHLLSGGPLDATAHGVLDRLAVIEHAIDVDSNRARGEIEQIRVAFRDWACLPEPLHQRFHAALASPR
jgi:hypothetical protein